MSDTTTITAEERMEKALARAQAFVKLHGHDNTACITSGELFLFRDALKCAQTEIEHWGKLYLMMRKDEQRLTKMVDWLAEKMADISDKMNSPNAPAYCVACNICPVDGNDMEGHTCLDAIEEAARRAVAAGEVKA